MSLGDTVERLEVKRSGFTLVPYLLLCDLRYAILPFSGLVSSVAKWR